METSHANGRTRIVPIVPRIDNAWFIRVQGAVLSV